MLDQNLPQDVLKQFTTNLEHTLNDIINLAADAGRYPNFITDIRARKQRSCAWAKVYAAKHKVYKLLQIKDPSPYFEHK